MAVEGMSEDRPGRAWKSSVALAVGAVIVAVALVAALLPRGTTAPPAIGQAGDVDLRVLAGAPATWDPAAAGDSTSVETIAQVFEGLTAFDHQNRVQPALAESWTIAGDARQIDFTLRPGLRYSDGTPIEAQHVVESWLRLLDPQRPSPLASLLFDIRGAAAYLRGTGSRDEVGLRAEGDRVVVELARPATYFLAVTASPPLAVVAPQMWNAFDGPRLPITSAYSGGYVAAALDESAIRLEANPNYWAGPPPLATVEIVTDTDGRGLVDMFESGLVDYTPVGSGDAAWLRYDLLLGPQLRQTPDLTLHFYGFDATRPPFDDVRVRQAFGQAVDWERIARLAGAEPARSMVPPGMPGGGSEDYRPPYDPAAARDLLAQAGYPDGAGFPALALVSSGAGTESAVAAELAAALNVTVDVEYTDYDAYLGRAGTPEAPLFWTLTWSADYPHAHDFLGLLLESGSANNEGGWQNADYDAAIEAAAATADPAEQEGHYADAQAILRDQVPVVPFQVVAGWALARDGLQGALPSGVGYIRFAGMDWQAGTSR